MSAIDELKRLLDERGVEYKTHDIITGKAVTWTGSVCNWVALPDERGLAIAVYKDYLTPEQAIATTLGKQKAKAHPYGYELDTGAFDATRCECGCLNDISATYCNDCGGEIEVDMDAKKEIYHTPRHMVFAEKHDDGSLEFCERRYVPEDAATLGKPMTDANLEQALSFMRIWISEDAHLGESELSAAFEKAEGLRKLDAIESAIADELCDRDYERKMDALLCRLTNGKFSKSRQYDLDFMESCVNEEFEQLYAGELADAMLGRGKLTAEQVRETVEKHWHDLPADYDMPESSALPEYSYDWQAITDELNATLGGGECEMETLERFDGDDPHYRCKVCGHENYEYELPQFCPNCGKVVKR